MANMNTRAMTVEAQTYADERTMRFGLVESTPVGSDIEQDLLAVARAIGHGGLFMVALVKQSEELCGGIRVPVRLE
ncbi:MAG: hypothetical protein EXR66_05705 [Dehalococcoidia bacterium]|nr:hypothetical protein [Dehalococcoidia bacterium]